jgi:prophage DNA circulation protein
VDPFSLLLLAQGAVSAITSGCEMLKQGRQIIKDVKGEVEGVVNQINDVKSQALGLYDEVTGLIDWAKGLWASLTGKPKPKRTNKPAAVQAPVAVQAKPVAKKAKQQEQEISYEEYQAQAVHEICENLKVYFEAIRQLKIHCRELEEEALTTEKVADSAIDRIEIQWQMKQLAAQLKQAMIYGTPTELGLGSMYQEFLIKYDEIVEEQEVARAVKAKKESDVAWQQEQRNKIRVAKLGYLVVITVVLMEILGLYFIL